MRLISKIKLISNKTTYWKIQASAKNFFILLALLNLDNFEQWSWGCFYVKKQKRHIALYLQLHNKALCSILPPLKGTSIRHWLEWLQDQAANLLCDLYFIVTHLSVQGKPRMCLGVFFFSSKTKDKSQSKCWILPRGCCRLQEPGKGRSGGMNSWRNEQIC